MMSGPKGIILAGGSGSRLHPITAVVNKHLLPVYDKPMIYYPLSTLMLAGIRHVLLITTPNDLLAFQRLLGDGGRLGMRIEYDVQPEPRGLAEAFLIGRDFIAADPVALALGDNIFCGGNLQPLLMRSASRNAGATVFACPVADARPFAVVQIDADGNIQTLEEKPPQPRSNLAVVGLYFYDNQVVELAGRIRPSARGELEITDLNREYLDQGELTCQTLDSSITWLDAGTPQSLLRASKFVAAIESRQGRKIACIEEVALTMGFITPGQLAELARPMRNEYGEYLQRCAAEFVRAPSNEADNGLVRRP